MRCKTLARHNGARFALQCPSPGNGPQPGGGPQSLFGIKFFIIAETIPPTEGLATLFIQDPKQKCALVIIADGFEETETIVFLASLRQAGLCVKSASLTSGLVGSVHGVRLMPDLTLADLDRLTDTAFISAVILSEGRQSLSRLEADPRVHRLLRRVIAQRGRIVTSREGLRVLRAAAVWVDEPGEADDGQRMPVLLREPGQSPEAFARELIRRLKHEHLRPANSESQSFLPLGGGSCVC